VTILRFSVVDWRMIGCRLAHEWQAMMKRVWALGFFVGAERLYETHGLCMGPREA
jgi:hypothetical protein